MKTHVLQSDPQTVHWGFCDASLNPVLTIDSGDQVVINCVSGNPDKLPVRSNGFQILPELEDVRCHSKKGPGNHVMTGPIFVRGATIGSVLEVRIISIELRQGWAFNQFRPYGGTLPEDFPYYRCTHIELDRETNQAITPLGLRVPLRSFFGQLAVAPPKAFGALNTKEPREFGGNIDCKELIAGSTIYLPVWNDGALFSTGDGHAAQGDGEVSASAAKTSLKGKFEFHVRNDLAWKIPRAETATHIIAFGLNVDLNDAAEQAVREMIDWIVALTRIERDEAYALCRIAVDLQVTQMVNGVQGIHAMLAKRRASKPVNLSPR